MRKGERDSLTEDMNGYKDGRDRKGAEPGRDLGTEMCESGYRVGGAVVAIIGCPSEVDAVKVAIDIVLSRTKIEKMSKGKLFWDIIW